jgi:predicted secreted Zn-dependent protease
MFSYTVNAQHISDSESSDIPIYKISWDFGFKESNSQCSIKNVNTTVTIETFDKKPSLELIYSTDKYKDSQMQKGLKIAEEIETALKAMPALNSCKLSASKANELARNIINKNHN